MLSFSNLIVPSSWASTANAFSDAAHLSTRELALKLELITQNAVHQFDANKFVLLSSLAYPNATLERFKVCNDWHSWLFFFDDQADGHAELGEQLLTLRDYMDACLAVLRTGAIRSNPAGLELFILNIRDRLLGIASEAWLPRFVDDVEDYLFKGTLRAAEKWSNGTVPDVESYRVQRRYDSAVYTCQDLIEITEEGLELSAEILTDTNFQKLRLLCAQIVAFTNDLFPYEKEVLVHRDPNNLLHVLMTHRSLSFEEATRQAVESINTDVETFITYEQALLPKIERDKRVRAYVHGMKAWMRGNILWSLETGRYSSVTSPFPELRLTSINGIAAALSLI